MKSIIYITSILFAQWSFGYELSQQSASKDIPVLSDLYDIPSIYCDATTPVKISTSDRSMLSEVELKSYMKKVSKSINPALTIYNFSKEKKVWRLDGEFHQDEATYIATLKFNLNGDILEYGFAWKDDPISGPSYSSCLVKNIFD